MKLYFKLCIEAYLESGLLNMIANYGCFMFVFLAKIRDVSHNKLDSEVVPKVARMTVSGKKQTMGFDVPGYLKSLYF